MRQQEKILLVLTAALTAAMLWMAVRDVQREMNEQAMLGQKQVMCAFPTEKALLRQSGQRTPNFN